MADSVLTKMRGKIDRNLTGIENRTDLSDDDKVSRLINLFAAICAGTAVQPLPFADFFILTPLQAYMGTRIASVRGIPVSESQMTDIVKELSGVIGLGFLAQQLALGAYKTVLPFLGGFTTIPMVYGLTYSMGRIMDYYLTSKAKGQQLDPQEIKSLWRKYKAEGEKQGKAYQQQNKKPQ